MEALLQLDRLLFVLVNSGWSDPLFDLPFWLLSWIGEGEMLAALGCLGLFLFDRRRFPKNFVVFALVMLIAGAAGQIFKRVFDKPRPMGDPALIQNIDDQTLSTEYITDLMVPLRTLRLPGEKNYADAGDGTVHILGRKLKKRGFPSGHTIAAFGLVTCLIYGFRRRSRYLWILLGVAMGISRIYVGAHYPLDVLGGIIVGVAVPWGLLKWTEKYHGLGTKKKTRKNPAAQPVIAIVAGEASADLYGANLIRAIKKKEPDAVVFGIGGEKMRETGFDCVRGSRDLAIVGFTGVLAALFKVLSIYKEILRHIKKRKPHVLITIDLPDFNLMLANQAQSLGTRVVYYISPQIWAWRTGRVHTIAQRTDLMIVAFPFEQEFYKKAGLQTKYFGHPMLETIDFKYDTPEKACRAMGLDPTKKIMVLAPGSRRNEIDHIAEPIFSAGARLGKELSGWQFAVPVAPGVDSEKLHSIVDQAGLKALFIRDDFHDLLKAASFGIITSGTATLEAALLGCPMLIVYKGNRTNAFIARHMIQINMIGLPNIIADEILFPEMIQDEATGQAIATKALDIIKNPKRFEEMICSCEKVRQALTGGDTSGKVADEILGMIYEEIKKGHATEDKKED